MGDPPIRESVTEVCYRHPSEETGVHCTRCGRPICPACMIPAPVGHHCPECVREARRQFRAGTGRRIRTVAGTSATSILLGIIVAMFLVELVAGAALARSSGPSLHALVDLGALAPPLIASGQYWRLISAMFLHAGLLHLLLNGYALWLFGRFVETTFGPVRFLAIFFVTGFLASVASYAFGPLGEVGVGASGAILGLLGAFIAYNFRRRHLALAAGNLRWAVMIIAINVLFGLTFPGIDNRAHLGGLVAGILAGVVAEGAGRRGVRLATQVLGFAALIALGIALTAWRTDAIRAALPGL